LTDWKQEVWGGAGMLADQHDKNAASGWQEYYSQETADLIYLLYAEDFRVFRYERLVLPAKTS
jgi:hypothetical protein